MRERVRIFEPNTVQEEGGSHPDIGIGNAKRRFAINASTSVGYLALSITFSLWYIPYLIKHLGVAAYGLVPLATSMTAYMSILTYGLNNAVGRFLTIDLVKDDREAANRTFNTALVGAMLIVGVLFPVTLGVSYAAPHIFDVPQGSEVEVQWLFFLVGAAFLLSIGGSSFAVSSFSCNRFDLQNWIQVLALLVRGGLMVAMFAVFTPQLWQIGIGTLSAAVVSSWGYVFLWNKLTPQLRVNLFDFDRFRLRALMGMGGWVTLNQVGALLFTNIDLIVVNMVFGAETTGRYGSVLQFSILLRSLASAVAGVLAPVVIAKYAQGDVDGMVRMARQAVKLMGLGMALPIGLLCGLARPLLGVWLGPSFQNLDVLLIILLGHLCVNLAVFPLFALQTSANRVRWPGIANLLMGFLNLGLAIAWAKWGAWGAVGVAAAGAVALTAKNMLFTPIYNARIFHLRWWAFSLDMLSGIIATLVVGLAAYGITQVYMPNGWLGLIGISVTVMIFYAVGAYALALNRADRQLLKGVNVFPMKG